MLTYATLLIIALAAAAITATKRATARRRLAEIDAGRRCIGCESTNVQITDGATVQCLACGHTASLAALARTKLTPEEIHQMTAPDRDRW